MFESLKTGEQHETRKKAVIAAYEKAHGLKLSGAELESLAERALRDPSISSDTKKKVSQGMKDKKQGGKKKQG